jgi:hypothetical protein
MTEEVQKVMCISPSSVRTFGILWNAGRLPAQHCTQQTLLFFSHCHLWAHTWHSRRSHTRCWWNIVHEVTSSQANACVYWKACLLMLYAFEVCSAFCRVTPCPEDLRTWIPLLQPFQKWNCWVWSFEVVPYTISIPLSAADSCDNIALVSSSNSALLALRLIELLLLHLYPLFLFQILTMPCLGFFLFCDF